MIRLDSISKQHGHYELGEVQARCDALGGEWKRRVAFARMLLMRPDVRVRA